jgi:hypothetical protein
MIGLPPEVNGGNSGYYGPQPEPPVPPTSAGLIYECDVDAAIVESIFVANHKDFVNSIDIAILPSGEDTVELRHHIVWDQFVNDNDYEVFRPTVPLKNGDRILAFSSVDEPMSVSVFGKVVVE